MQMTVDLVYLVTLSKKKIGHFNEDWFPSYLVNIT